MVDHGAYAKCTDLFDPYRAVWQRIGRLTPKASFENRPVDHYRRFRHKASLDYGWR